MRVVARRKFRDPGRLRLCLALLISLILHGIALFLLTVVFPKQVPEAMLSVRLVEHPRFQPKRFAAGKTRKRPAVLMEMEKPEGAPEWGPSPHELPSPPLGMEPTDQGLFGVPLPPGRGEKGAGLSFPPEMPSLDDKALKYIEERERYRWLGLVDADTSDVESIRKRIAQQIVDRAIEALGGLEALRNIRDRVVDYELKGSRTGRYRPAGTTYHRRMGYVRSRYPGIRIGCDGKQAWHDWYGLIMPYPAGDLRRQAERWDFLSRFRGDGVELKYLSQRLFEREDVYEIEVRDLKYGVKEKALFNARTYLPAGIITAARNLAMNTSWHPDSTVTVVYDEYTSIDGIMTATWTRESVPRMLIGVVKRLHTRYNEGLDDTMFRRPDDRPKERPELVAAADMLVSEEVLPRSQYSLGLSFEIVPELRPPLCGRYRKPCLTPLEKALMCQTIMRTFSASKLFCPVVLLDRFWLVDSDLEVDYVLLCRIVDGAVAIGSRPWLEVEVGVSGTSGDMFWESTRLRIELRSGPVSLITDMSATTIAGTIFNVLGGALGTGQVVLLDHPTIQRASHPVKRMPPE